MGYEDTMAPAGFGSDYGNPVVSIQRVENGWIVTVDNPHRHVDPTEKLFKAMASVLPQINALAGAGAVRGMDEEADPYKENDADREEKASKKLEQVQAVVNEAFAEKPQLRKPREILCFLTHESLLKFLSEQLK